MRISTIKSGRKNAVKNPWLELPKHAPFILKADKKIVGKKKYGFQTNRLPEPFIGDLKAKLVLLNLNPSTGKNDRTPQNKGAFAAAVRANLKLKEGVEYPFYYLNPKLEKHEGSLWWQKKIKKLIAQNSDRKDLSRRILAIEFCGYPSARKNSVNEKLAGDDYRDLLVLRAIKRDAHIIIMKGLREWIVAIPELKKHSKTWVLTSPQNASVKPECLARYAFGSFAQILETISKPHKTR